MSSFSSNYHPHRDDPLITMNPFADPGEEDHGWAQAVAPAGSSVTGNEHCSSSPAAECHRPNSDVDPQKLAILDDSDTGDESEEYSGDGNADDAQLRPGRQRGQLDRRHHPARRRSIAPGAQQDIILEHDDLHLLISGYRTRLSGVVLHWVLSIATIGLFHLLTRWIPRIRIRILGQSVQLALARWVVVQDQYGLMEIIPVQRVSFGGGLLDAFTTQSSMDDRVIPYLFLIEYRHLRFILHPDDGVFVLASSWKDPAWTSVEALRRPFPVSRAHTVVMQRQALLGKNSIDVPVPPIQKLLVDEVLNPFYVFQIFSMILWLFEDYEVYAVTIFIMSASSIALTLIETRANMRRMREMARFHCEVPILRGSGWRLVASEELVPGDVMDIGSLKSMPCDAILVDGDCIVNESMLTGESIPVSKSVATDSAVRRVDLTAHDLPPDIAKHFLFAGTKIVRARPGRLDWSDGEERAVATVVRTGFNASKGALVRSMLFPRPSKFKFYEDSFRFIGVLGLIAVLGFLGTVINLIRIGVPVYLIAIRALDLITVVVPPALPATMTIGLSFALSRLRDRRIFCTSPPRINVSGKINCVCFDKTGTLTEEGLDVQGVYVVDSANGRFSDMIKRADMIPDGAELSVVHTLATCHSLKMVHGELIGDPLDFKMFEFTNWSLEESEAKATAANELIDNGDGSSAASAMGMMPTVVRPPGVARLDSATMLRLQQTGMIGEHMELGIIRCFEFASQLRRMSVLVRRFGMSQTQVFCKGAPEVMQDICRPESLPVDYHGVLDNLAHRGFRVIACAGRTLAPSSWIKMQRLKREQVERDLHFLGFIVFENKVKESTPGVIRTLHDAAIRQIMCTGDNILTAVSVSRECGIINSHTNVYAARFAPEQAALEWTCMGRDDLFLNPDLLIPTGKRMPPPVMLGAFATPVDPTDYALAVSGQAFRWIVDRGDQEMLARVLSRGQIYARMSPDEKHELVELLQEQGYCVSFCGDGANDVGALKQADCGISLSEAEASVAAPFTSQLADISCVPAVIREGRAALVTSFSCFKYMALYSLIQFTTISMLYSFDYTLGDWQFLWIDLFIILPVAVFMGRTGASEKLSVKRPTASLVSAKVLTSIIGQIVLQAVFQSWLFESVRQQSWYQEPIIDPDKPNILSYENTALFLLSSFQYIFIAVVFSVGPPYRKSMITNVPYLTATAVLIFVTVAFVLLPSQTLQHYLQLKSLPYGFRIGILLAATCNFALAWLGEKYAFGLLARTFKGMHRKWRGGAEESAKNYKRTEASMRQEILRDA